MSRINCLALGNDILDDDPLRTSADDIDPTALMLNLVPAHPLARMEDTANTFFGEGSASAFTPAKHKTLASYLSSVDDTKATEPQKQTILSNLLNR